VYVDDTWPGGLDGLAEQIREEEPTFVTVDHPDWYDFAAPVLDDDYEELGTTYLMTWYVDRSVGEEELARLREVVGADLPDDE